MILFVFRKALGKKSQWLCLLYKSWAEILNETLFLFGHILTPHG